MYSIQIVYISTGLVQFWDDFPKIKIQETWTHPPTSIVNSDFFNFLLCKAPKGGLLLSESMSCGCPEGAGWGGGPPGGQGGRHETTATLQTTRAPQVAATETGVGARGGTLTAPAAGETAPRAGGITVFMLTAWMLLSGIAVLMLTAWMLLSGIAVLMLTAWMLLSGISVLMLTVWMLLSGITVLMLTAWMLLFGITVLMLTARMLLSGIAVLMLTVWMLLSGITVLMLTAWMLLSGIAVLMLTAWMLLSGIAVLMLTAWMLLSGITVLMFSCRCSIYLSRAKLTFIWCNKYLSEGSARPS